MMAKPKPVNWGIIDDPELYNFVNGIIEKFHGGEKGIEGVNFVLMWRYNVKTDQDGYILLSSVSKSSDQVRELRPHDVIIGINKDAWSILDDAQKRVVIDSQLERIAVCVDKQGEPREDDQSRTIYRLRRTEVLDEPTLKRRHGLTLQEVQEFVYNKFEEAGAEEGSYVANVLSGKDPEDEPITLPMQSTNDDEEDYDDEDGIARAIQGSN